MATSLGQSKELAPSYQIVDNQSDLGRLLAKLEQRALFAFDCESVKLNREHKVSLMNVCLEDGSIFLVDIQALGGIDARLKRVLEDKNITKVMFDCRSDADSLYHQHNVKLQGIEDMQIMHFLIANTLANPGRRLAGFLFVLGRYLGQEAKESLAAVKGEDYSGWGVRPVPKELLEYASTEISLFFPARVEILKKSRKSQEEIKRLSENYARVRRENANYKESDPYQSHGYMPLDVLSPVRHGSTKCVGCRIQLDSSEFAWFDVRRGEPTCIVCKAVKEGQGETKKQASSYCTFSDYDYDIGDYLEGIFGNHDYDYDIGDYLEGISGNHDYDYDIGDYLEGIFGNHDYD